MKGPSLENAVEEDTDVDDIDLDVTVKCQFCSRLFSGKQDLVGDELFKHIWKHHDDEAVDFMISNMFVPDNIKSMIFAEMGSEYISWLIDNGEINE